MLKSCQDVPYMTFMQISAAITEKHNFRYNSANTAYIITNKVSIPTFLGSRIAKITFIRWYD